MTFNITGPGKTAPKLYQDFLIFDPVKGVPNVLEQFSPPHGDGPQLAPQIGSCRHEYVTKASQSVAPPLDLRDDGSTIYKIAAVCKKCRIHTEVHVDHSNASNPCPASEHPLHHFQRAKAYDNKSEERIQFAWRCSVAQCRATLCIVYRKARWDEEDIQLLSNPERLKRRYEALIQDDPNREGIKLATQMDAFSRLRRYVKDSLVPSHTKRQIPANNKRFQEAYGINGEDCAEILNWLGFRLVVSFVLSKVCMRVADFRDRTTLGISQILNRLTIGYEQMVPARGRFLKTLRLSCCC
jgi:ubiquitin carboxyl-terminal hydrolase 25